MKEIQANPQTNINSKHNFIKTRFTLQYKKNLFLYV